MDHRHDRLLARDGIGEDPIAQFQIVGGAAGAFELRGGDRDGLLPEVAHGRQDLGAQAALEDAVLLLDAVVLDLGDDAVDALDHRIQIGALEFL